MKRFLLVVLTFACCAFAQAQAPRVPAIAARSYLLVDVTANQVLAEQNATNPVEPASLTKLMSAYVVFDTLRAKKLALDQTLPVSEKAWKMPGSRMFVSPHTNVAVDDLIKGMIVQSGNDATMVLAEGIAGSADQFVAMMNQQAKALGMNATSYKNPVGLTEIGHITTAHDLSILATRLMHDFPEYMHYYAMKKYRYPGTPVSNENNRNLLLFRDPTVDGLKTGHTNAAGFCLIATARRDYPNLADLQPAGRRLLAIVLGTNSEAARANETQKLLNWGYTAYDPVKLFDANQPVTSPTVWKGQQSTVKLGRPTAIVIDVPAGEAGKIQTQISRNEPLVAPLIQGQQLGTLQVSLAGSTIASVPLEALESVPEAGPLGRFWDSLRMWIK